MRLSLLQYSLIALRFDAGLAVDLVRVRVVAEKQNLSLVKDFARVVEVFALLAPELRLGSGS